MTENRFDARAKFIALLAALLICVTTPPDAARAFAGYIGAALVLTIYLGIGRTLLRNLLAILPLLVLCAAFIPFFRPDQTHTGYHAANPGLILFSNILFKAVFGVTAVTAFAATTPLPDLLAALERFRLPRLLIMTAAFMHRYVHLLIADVRRMKRARDARCANLRWLWHAGDIGRMIGALFLRSYERGERVYLALLARGYAGRFHAGRRTPLRRTDYALAAAAIILFLSLRVWGAA